MRLKPLTLRGKYIFREDAQWLGEPHGRTITRLACVALSYPGKLLIQMS